MTLIYETNLLLYFNVLKSYNLQKKSRILETLNHLMGADSSNNTKSPPPKKTKKNPRKKPCDRAPITCHLSHVTNAYSHGPSPC